MGSRYEDIMKAKNYLPFRMGYITEEMTEKAEKELGETAEIRTQTFLELIKLIQEEKKLRCPTEDEYLLQYLRARKFNVKKAFQLLKNFWQVKKTYSEVYSECDIDAIEKLFETGGISCLPFRDEEGCVIIILKIAKWNTEEFKVQKLFSALTALILRCIDDPATQICGVRIIVDVKGTSLRHLSCLTPRYLNLFSKALRNCLPVRFKGVHIFNESTMFQYIWSILKIFLSEKIKQRVHFHGDNQKLLQKFVPKILLTSEYGGDNTEFNAAQWCETELKTFLDRYRVLLSFGYQD